MNQNETELLEDALSGGGMSAVDDGAMRPAERRATIALASIFALRMLGLFMILPVFALHAHRYTGHTAALVGVAIGAYGLTQALLQIPFGLLSDRLGRKPVITGGLLLFAAGSVVAALAESMYGVIAGRALQGAGAIAAAVMALTADLTREEQRTKAMASIGASIGLAFAVALIMGPIVSRWTGLPGLFWLTGALALAGIAVLHVYVPDPQRSRFHRDTETVPAQLGRALSDPQLLRLDFGILSLHMVLTASFVAVPLVLRDRAGLAAADHWIVYLGVLLGSVALMIPCIIVAERRGWTKEVFVGAVLALAVSQLALAFLHHGLAQVVVLMLLFFTAFNVLEATLPSLVSRLAPPEMKGTALGAYSTSQFFGAFLGGLLGGWLYGQHGAGAVFLGCTAIAALWLLAALTMRRPRRLASRLLSVGKLSAEQASLLAGKLNAVPGVAEAVVVAEDGVAYLKIDRATLDEQALRTAAAAQA